METNEFVLLLNDKEDYAGYPANQVTEQSGNIRFQLGR
jgi:hypothetical protein